MKPKPRKGTNYAAFGAGTEKRIGNPLGPSDRKRHTDSLGPASRARPVSKFRYLAERFIAWRAERGQ